MARIPSIFFSALTLSALTAPVLAGPAISTQGPGDGGAPPAPDSTAFAVECQINGRSESFVIAGDALAGRAGSVTRLDAGVFSILTDQGGILLTGDSAQIDGGPDAGKWDCVPATAALVTNGGAFTADPAAQATLEQRLATARAALEATQDDLIATMIERDAAQDAVAAAEARADAAVQEIEALQSELAASLHMEETAQAARIRAEEMLSEREAELAAARQELQARQTRGAELETALAAEEAENAALRAELAGLRAEEDMTQRDMDGDDAPAESAAPEASVEPQFDADAALARLEAADIGDIARAALRAAVEQARANPEMGAEVMARLQAALGQ